MEENLQINDISNETGNIGQNQSADSLFQSTGSNNLDLTFIDTALNPLAKPEEPTSEPSRYRIVKGSEAYAGFGRAAGGDGGSGGDGSGGDGGSSSSDGDGGDTSSTTTTSLSTATVNSFFDTAHEMGLGAKGRNNGENNGGKGSTNTSNNSSNAGANAEANAGPNAAAQAENAATNTAATGDASGSVTAGAQNAANAAVAAMDAQEGKAQAAVNAMNEADANANAAKGALADAGKNFANANNAVAPAQANDAAAQAALAEAEAHYSQVFGKRSVEDNDDGTVTVHGEISKGGRFGGTTSVTATVSVNEDGTVSISDVSNTGLANIGYDNVTATVETNADGGKTVTVNYTDSRGEQHTVTVTPHEVSEDVDAASAVVNAAVDDKSGMSMLANMAVKGKEAVEAAKAAEAAKAEANKARADKATAEVNLVNALEAYTKAKQDYENAEAAKQQAINAANEAVQAYQQAIDNANNALDAVDAAKGKTETETAESKGKIDNSNPYSGSDSASVDSAANAITESMNNPEVKEAWRDTTVGEVITAVQDFIDQTQNDFDSVQAMKDHINYFVGKVQAIAKDTDMSIIGKVEAFFTALMEFAYQMKGMISESAAGKAVTVIGKVLKLGTIIGAGVFTGGAAIAGAVFHDIVENMYRGVKGEYGKGYEGWAEVIEAGHQFSSPKEAETFFNDAFATIDPEFNLDNELGDRYTAARRTKQYSDYNYGLEADDKQKGQLYSDEDVKGFITKVYRKSPTIYKLKLN